MVGKNSMDEKADEKKGEGKTISPEKPLIIEPDELKPDLAKPVMPELKGEPGKKIERVKKPVKRLPQQRSKVLTFVLFLCLIFMAGAMAFLVLPVLNISVPDWINSVMNLYRKLPLFPE